MKKLIAINGSPRRNWNTAELLKHAMKGAQDAGTTAELVNLYTLNFKGCTSCFACKTKTRPHGICAMKDDLAPVLEQVKDADEKFAYRAAHFAEDCAAAYEIGRDLVSR